MVHRLQTAFATFEGECGYTQELARMIGQGELDDVQTVLTEDLAALDTELARTCLATPREAVAITGWADLADAIAMHEGTPITGMTIGLANELDLAFEKEKLHDPILLHALYTDTSFPWSTTPPAQLLAQCMAEDPPWMDQEEDIEIYLEIEGLKTINTALLRHKRRYFLRDDNPETAPRTYVEAVLASWFRALRFHQAVAAEVAIHGLPGRIEVLSGTVEMHADAVMHHCACGKTAPDVFGSLTTLRIGRHEPRKAERAVLSGSAIRHSIAAAHATRQDEAREQTVMPAAPQSSPAKARAVPSAPAPKRGFLARLFGRG